MNFKLDDAVMSQREVAEALGINKATVYKIEQEAMAKIKKAFEERNIDIKMLLED